MGVSLSGTLRCATPQQAETVRAHLDSHVRLTRAEPGCRLFNVAPTDDPLVWTVREEFRDRAAFEAHQARARASDWGRATHGIAREFIVEET